MTSPDAVDPAPAPEPAPDEAAPPIEDAAAPEPTDDDELDVDVEGEDDAAEVESDLQELGALDVLAATEKERDEYLDRLQRLQADFENYKKRMQRLQSETLERAGEGLATKLLPVLDTIDLAKQHGAGEGVEQIANALFDVLAKEGLERIDPVGEPFDPNEHEAVSHEPGEGDGEPVVSHLMRAGYRWKGRLVRAAMVTVRG